MLGFARLENLIWRLFFRAGKTKSFIYFEIQLAEKACVRVLHTLVIIHIYCFMLAGKGGCINGGMLVTQVCTRHVSHHITK